MKSESEVAQLCPTHSDPVDRSPSGSSIHGIFQARVLEWGAICIGILLFNVNCNSFFFLIYLLRKIKAKNKEKQQKTQIRPN